MTQVRVRFAPSPTGNLHIGTLRTALFNWVFAKSVGGQYVLRIEDTDQDRSEKTFEANIYDGLAWMGLTADEGPDEGGNYGPYRQSERHKAGIYKTHADRLLSEKKAYRCFCTSEDLEAERQAAKAAKIPYKYSQTCLKLSDDEIAKKLAENIPFSIRVAMPNKTLSFNDLVHDKVQFDLGLISDFIIVKPDGYPSFHFAVVVDDALMEITHVIRGEDHISNTPRHILLYELLGFPPPQYGHLPMILGPDKAKLSKRHGATAVTDYQTDGYLSEALFNYLSLLGWSPPDGQEMKSISEIVNVFGFDRVSKSNAIFDTTKLGWMNGQYIRKLGDSKLIEATTPYLSKDTETKLRSFEKEKWPIIFRSVRDNLTMLSEINHYLFVYFMPESIYKETITPVEWSDEQIQVLRVFSEALQTSPSPNMGDVLQDTRQKTGFKPGQVFKPIRLAVTGQTSGPNLADILTVFGPDFCLKRVTHITGS